MAVEQWSANLLVVRLGNDPQFTDDLGALENYDLSNSHIVLDFSAVGFLNSSNLARLLKLRKLMRQYENLLVLCGVNTTIWGTFLTTGLDKIFEFSDDVATALATIQMS